MKHPHTLSRQGTGLLILDVQEKFGPVIPGFDSLVNNVLRLVFGFQMFDMPILVTEQYPKGLGGTVGKIKKHLKLIETVEKLELSATDNEVFSTRLDALKLGAMVVCGIETHVCVNQTVHGLLASGMCVHVVADAVGSRHTLDHNLGLRKMEKSGALICTTEMCIFELAEKAGTEQFKNIQRMVRPAKKAGDEVKVEGIRIQTENEDAVENVKIVVRQEAPGGKGVKLQEKKEVPAPQKTAEEPVQLKQAADEKPTEDA